MLSWSTKKRQYFSIFFKDLLEQKYLRMRLASIIAGGNLSSSILLKLLYPSPELFSSAVLGRQLRCLRFLPFLAIVGAVIWRTQMQRHTLQIQAAEAQLRLLHAQIEPHFPVSALANIESLRTADPSRARAMLEAFSDYLRAGLNQLRTSETTLGAVLDFLPIVIEAQSQNTIGSENSRCVAA